MPAAIQNRGPSHHALSLSEFALCGVLALGLALLLAKSILLTTADVGRHLANGRVILRTQSVPETNLYSYTQPAFPFIDHHWLSGVVFQLIVQHGGFRMLSALSIVLNVLAFLLFFRVAWKESSLTIAAIVALLSLPLIASRSEIRPETFTYLNASVFFYVLWEHRQGRVQRRWLALLPVIELLWVNLHIYFFLGLFLIGCFLIDEGIRARRREPATGLHSQRVLDLLLTAVAAGAATLLNPAGLRGAVYPFRIFQHYGYEVAENLSVWEFERRPHAGPLLYFKISCALLVASWCVALWSLVRKKGSPPVATLLLSLFTTVIAWTAVRNFALYAYFAMPIVSINAGTFERLRRATTWRPSVAPVATMLAVVALYSLDPGYWQDAARQAGFGVDPADQRPIAFFRDNGLRGPIFNNYDIGNFLIWGLFPRERVFVDNRPEAYPESFLNELIRMQQDDRIWKQLDDRYHFNVIFFYRRDAAAWGQAFLIRRVFDRAWAPVFVDRNTIIILRRTAENDDIIKKYELSREIFSVRHSG